MRNPFRHSPIDVYRRQQLEEAQRDLLSAEHNLEHWLAQRDMLKHRIERLERELDTTPKEIPHVDHLPLRQRARTA